MDSEAKKLISRATALVQQTLEKGSHRRGYPLEVRTIVRTLIFKYGFTTPQLTTLLPVSQTYISRQCLVKTKRTKSMRGKKIQFKKISVGGEKTIRREPPRYLPLVTAALALVAISQALSLIFFLSLR